MIAALPLVTRARSTSTLAPLASRVPSGVDPASLRPTTPLFTIVAQKDRVVMPAPVVAPVIKGGGSGLPGVPAGAAANAAILPAPAPSAPPALLAPPTGNPGVGGGGSSPTDPTPSAADPGSGGYASGAPSFSADSFKSPVFLIGAAVVAAGALYFLTRKR